MMVDIEEVLAKVTFTPAERAVLVEQAEAIKIGLDALIQRSKAGTAEEIGRAFLELTRHSEYVGNLVTTKFQHTAIAIEEERRS